MSDSKNAGQGERIDLINNNQSVPAIIGLGLWNLVVYSTNWAGRTVTFNVGNSITEMVPLGGVAYTFDSGSIQYGGKYFQAVSSNGDYTDMSISLRRAA